MDTLFLPHAIFLSDDELHARADRAARRGMFLDTLKHGGVAVLRTRMVEVAFLNGLPAGYLNKTTGALFVSAELKLSQLAWHRQQVVAIWNRSTWQWCEPQEVFDAFALNRAELLKLKAEALDTGAPTP